jgi:site-specific recombinase XerD
LPVIGNLAVTDVRKGHITEIIDRILARDANRMAKVILALTRQMFRFAVDRDIIEFDPTSNLKKSKIGGKNVERDRVLSEDELRKLAQKLPDAHLL